MKRALTVLLLLLTPVVARAQSLADAAAKETARRKEKEAKEKAQTYTNDDLDHGVKKSASPSPAPPAQTASTNEAPPLPSPNKEEASWRSRAESARNGVKQAESKVASLEAQAQDLLTKRLLSTDTNEILRLSAEQKDVLDQIGPAKEEVETAKKALQDFEDSARQAGIPAGWTEPSSP